MYRVIIYGCPDEFAESAMARKFTRRGLIRFLSRHLNKLFGYETLVAVSRDNGLVYSLNYFLVAKRHERPLIKGT